jgi:RNA polymerase sigma-70 factor (ECF subfamily)
MERVMEISDHELMQKIKDGNIPAFDTLVKRWEHRLYNVVYKIIGDPETTRDICQDVFLQVYQSSKKYRPYAQFETWFYRIAINRSINELKKRKRHQTYSLTGDYDGEKDSFEDELLDPEPQPDEIAQQNEISSCIQNALENIPTEQRIVVILRHYEGLKFQQIADILNCPLGTVKSRMYLAMDQLKTMLKHIV